MQVYAVHLRREIVTALECVAELLHVEIPVHELRYRAFELHIVFVLRRHDFFLLGFVYVFIYAEVPPFFLGTYAPLMNVSIFMSVSQLEFTRGPRTGVRRPVKSIPGMFVLENRYAAAKTAMAAVPAEDGEGKGDGMDEQTKERFDRLENGVQDIAERINEISCMTLTAEKLEDILRYTTVPVIVTDTGPAPKRPNDADL